MPRSLKTYCEKRRPRLTLVQRMEKKFEEREDKYLKLIGDLMEKEIDMEVKQPIYNWQKPGKTN